jgi:hypothetical protein
MDKHPTHIKYHLPWDYLPVDISFMFEDEKPAGKHGFLQAKGSKFVFEDGTEARFWGTNFNSGACFPPKDHAPKVAKRLAMMGINMVRFHQMDAEWSRPGIFEFAKGPLLKDTQTLDPRSMDLLDHFIYCLKEEGVYVYMDLLTYRRYREGDGVENAGILHDAAPYNLYNRRMIELQKKFNRDIFNHYNPYTKLEYKNDPCIVLAEMINETSFYYDNKKVKDEPYRHELCELYRNWAKENGHEEKTDEQLDFCNPDDTLHEFFIEVMKDYNKELIDDLKSIGVKIPLTGTNQSLAMAVVEAQEDTDFMDNHDYVPLGGVARNSNYNPVGVDRALGAMVAMAALPDKPLFISEWDSCYPNEFRAAAPLHLASVMAFQGWSGATIHTYRYGNNVESWLTQRIGRHHVIHLTHNRGGWDSYNDPAKFGLFYHAAIITRRGDVAQAKEDIAITGAKYGDTPGSVTALFAAPEQHRVQIQLSDDKKVDANHTSDIHEDLFTGDELISDTGELFRNKKLGNGWVDTAMTKVIYGMRRRDEAVSITGLEVVVKNDFYTIAISSLDNLPIEESNNMLMTVVGRVDNKGVKYDADRTSQIEQGEGPAMMEVIQASIKMKTSMERVRVLAVNYEGFLSGSKFVIAEDGNITFDIGEAMEHSSLYYLIQKG